MNARTHTMSLNALIALKFYSYQTGLEIELLNSLNRGTKSTRRHADSYGEHPLILLFCESPCGFRLQHKHRDILPDPSVC